MEPSEFLDILERLLGRLKAGGGRPVSGVGERRNIRSVVGVWFSEYRGPCIQIVGEGQTISIMDEWMQRLLKLASTVSARRTVTRAVAGAIDHFTESLLVPVSRAYWSRVPEKTPAGRDAAVAAQLRQLDTEFGDGYEQAVLDIENDSRLSYRGPAAELREILTGVLQTLAPNEEVEKMDWYRDARRSGARKETTPTRAERTKFILRSRAKGTAVTEAAESYMTSVEDRLANLVNATYKRGSAATHGGTEREELLQLLPYVNALLRELLPLPHALTSGVSK